MAIEAGCTEQHVTKHLTILEDSKTLSMGHFEELPLELRDAIYVECIHLKSVVVLRLNSDFHSEYLKVLQRMKRRYGIINFHVDPARHPSTVQVLTEFGRPLTFIDAASPHLHFETNPVRNMPIGRFERQQILIDPPDPRDPGQAIRLCKQLSALTTSLSACWFQSAINNTLSRKSYCLYPRQMQISSDSFGGRIIFQEKPGRSWTTKGKWNKSLRDCDDGQDNGMCWARGCSDFRLALQLLQCLRRAPMNIVLPPTDLSYRLHQFCKEIIETTRSELDFGLNWCNDHICLVNDISDHNILEKIASLQVWHEYLLDDLPGRSANLLRQERFLRWCTAYEVQHVQALYGVLPPITTDHGLRMKHSHLAGARERLSPHCFRRIVSSFHSRVWARTVCDLNSPTGVERKSGNKHWTEFLEKPHARLSWYEGIDSLAEPSASRNPQHVITDCNTCRAEKHKNRDIQVQKDVCGMLDVLSAHSGLALGQ